MVAALAVVILTEAGAPVPPPTDASRFRAYDVVILTEAGAPVPPCLNRAFGFL